MSSIGALVVALFLGGCAARPPETKPIHHYVLSPAAIHSPKKADDLRPNITLAVQFNGPHYLQRTEVVVRQSPQQLVISDTERWLGEPIKVFEQVFRRDLAQHLGIELSLVRVPEPGATRARTELVTVSGEIIQFDGQLNGEITLRASWKLEHSIKEPSDSTDHIIYGVEPSSTLTQQGEVKVRVADTGLPGYDGYVAAMSQALDALAGLVAQDIRKISAPKGTPQE
jgi:uncharacterized lipoprotein YmbA